MQKRCNDAGFDVVAVSADTAVKAAADIAEYGWSFPVGCDLDQATMHALGLYVSDPLTPDATDRRFAEPAVLGLRLMARFRLQQSPTDLQPDLTLKHYWTV